MAATNASGAQGAPATWGVADGVDVGSDVDGAGIGVGEALGLAADAGVLALLADGAVCGAQPTATMTSTTGKSRNEGGSIRLIAGSLGRMIPPSTLNTRARSQRPQSTARRPVPFVPDTVAKSLTNLRHGLADQRDDHVEVAHG
jgi:hypothetical protein